MENRSPHEHPGRPGPLIRGPLTRSGPPCAPPWPLKGLKELNKSFTTELMHLDAWLKPTQLAQAANASSTAKQAAGSLVRGSLGLWRKRALSGRAGRPQGLPTDISLGTRLILILALFSLGL